MTEIEIYLVNLVILMQIAQHDINPLLHLYCGDAIDPTQSNLLIRINNKVV